MIIWFHVQSKKRIVFFPVCHRCGQRSQAASLLLFFGMRSTWMSKERHQRGCFCVRVLCGAPYVALCGWPPTQKQTSDGLLPFVFSFSDGLQPKSDGLSTLVAIRCIAFELSGRIITFKFEFLCQWWVVSNLCTLFEGSCTASRQSHVCRMHMFHPRTHKKQWLS